MNIFGLDPQAKDRTLENKIWRETAPVGLTRFFLKLRIKYLLLYFLSIAAVCFSIAIVVDYWNLFVCAAVVFTVFLVSRWLVKKYLNGGSFILVAENVSYLYYQAKIVYPKMSEKGCRFLAIYMNTASNRKHFSGKLIRDIVFDVGNLDWSVLCSVYCWMYSESCGGPSFNNTPKETIELFNQKVLEKTIEIQKNVSNGRVPRRFDDALRSLSQVELIGIIHSYDLADD